MTTPVRRPAPTEAPRRSVGGGGRAGASIDGGAVLLSPSSLEPSKLHSECDLSFQPERKKKKTTRVQQNKTRYKLKVSPKVIRLRTQPPPGLVFFFFMQMSAATRVVDWVSGYCWPGLCRRVAAVSRFAFCFCCRVFSVSTETCRVFRWLWHTGPRQTGCTARSHGRRIIC